MNKIQAGIIGSLALALLLSGCAQVNVDVKPSSAETKEESSLEITEIEDETTDEVSDEVAESEVENETEENISEDELTEEESSAQEEIVDTADGMDAIEDSPADSMSEYLVQIKKNHNSEPVNLRPTVGDFCEMDEEGLDTVANPDAEQYGFWDDLTGGCSVWCAVNDYDVSVEASSTLEPQGSQTYDAENLLNGDRNNAWVEGVKGNGIGETVRITKSYDVECAASIQDSEECIFYYELCIVNGLARNEKVWKENGRVKSLKFYYNDEYQGTIELEDTMKPQFISLSGLNLAALSGEKNSFTFEIADVYPGDKYEDTAITGIEIAFDTPNH